MEKYSIKKMKRHFESFVCRSNSEKETSTLNNICTVLTFTRIELELS
jgi:hypothetical protein